MQPTAIRADPARRAHFCTDRNPDSASRFVIWVFALTLAFAFTVFPVDAGAQEVETRDAGLTAAKRFYVSAAIADLGATMYGEYWTRNGQQTEANKAISWLEPKVGLHATLAVGEAVDVAAIYLLDKWLAKKHPKILKAGLWSVGGLRFWMAAENVRKANQFRDYETRQRQCVLTPCWPVTAR